MYNFIAIHFLLFYDNDNEVLKESHTMKYALLGDLHSNVADTKAVLAHIKKCATDATIIGLGDLYECLVGKKKALKVTGLPIHEAAIISEEFEKLLSFPSIRGNQEERISKVTGLQQYLQYPETMTIEQATLMHGHQFEWNEKWQPIKFPASSSRLLFFGHSHESAIYNNKKKLKIQFHQPISVAERRYAINVGSVIGNREWCLYDAQMQTVTFMKVT